ncbi:[4Fe-4S] proteins maturation [Xylographa opegraphella]|nr:[4Fe-4S] proteins maturation [Xylographa opegraphella]
MRSCIRCLDTSRTSVLFAKHHGTTPVANILVHNDFERIPSFLLPAFTQQRGFSRSTAVKLPPPSKTSGIPFVQRSVPRSFTSSSQSRAAVVTANPRKDEDGNDMLIDITPRASKRLREIMAKDDNPSLALRVTVQSGGCHGFQYLMSLTNSAKISAEDDTVFEATDGTGAKVVMDEPSLELLKGSQVDFTMELIGSQFKIVGNPAATSSCGCGTSFDIKA